MEVSRIGCDGCACSCAYARVCPALLLEPRWSGWTGVLGTRAGDSFLSDDRVGAVGVLGTRPSVSPGVIRGSLGVDGATEVAAPGRRPLRGVLGTIAWA